MAKKIKVEEVMEVEVAKAPLLTEDMGRDDLNKLRDAINLIWEKI
tara:strand:- start:121 stop:255 length:135 start_codon:yes stop_codon:yes gene_type:complete